MSKLWCIALAFGDPQNNGALVSATYVAPTADLAAAMVVSMYYTDNPGVRLPLSGVAARELTRDYLEAALKAMDEPEPQPAVVPLRIVDPNSGMQFPAMACNHDWTSLDPRDPLQHARRCRWCGTPEPEPQPAPVVPRRVVQTGEALAMQQQGIVGPHFPAGVENVKD